MSVIVELTLPADVFELGRILAVEGDTHIELETMVPIGARSIPFFRVFEGRDSFETKVGADDSVSDITEVSSQNGEILYGLDWDSSDDSFFQGIIETEASILEASGSQDTWAFNLRFTSHEDLSTFQSYCLEHDLPIEVQGLYNPTKPEAGPWFGLTPQQRVALSRAVEEGYYSIPRETSTRDLADEFDISDQAMTERLRRAIVNLVTNTLLLTE